MLNVLMPFSRPKNFLTLKSQICSEGVRWIPIITQTQNAELPPRLTTHSQFEPIIVPDPPKSFIGILCFYKINMAIAKLRENLPESMKEHYYLTADDNGWSHGFFPKLAKQVTPGTEVILLSELRPNGSFLEAHPARMKAFMCDFSMFCVRGDILSEVPFNDLIWYDDSLWAERVAERCLVTCLKSPVIYYNALRSKQWGYGGVWDDEAAK